MVATVVGMVDPFWKELESIAK